MRGNLTLTSKASSIAAILALVTSATPVLATEYIAGVKIGNWIEYDVNASWSFPDTEPSGFRYDWVRLEIKNMTNFPIPPLIQSLMIPP